MALSLLVVMLILYYFLEYLKHGTKQATGVSL